MVGSGGQSCGNLPKMASWWEEELEKEVDDDDDDDDDDAKFGSHADFQIPIHRQPRLGASQSNMTTTTDLQTLKTRNPLFQQDLFHCILDSLVAPNPSLQQLRESRSVLVSLAQSCPAFSEPCLDRLWSKLDSLEPLIRCFATVLSEERAKVG